MRCIFMENTIRTLSDFKNYSMEQSKFGTFMIDDLYLYRASDDYKQVIEEKIVLPEYDKIKPIEAFVIQN